jgi:hypothetical protein
MKKVKLINAVLLFFFMQYTFVSFSQNVGIGTTNPVAKLSILGSGNTSSTNAFALFNSDGDTLVRVRDDGRMGIGFNDASYGRTLNIGGTGINFFTSIKKFGGAIFPTDTSLILWSNNQSINNYLVFQPSWGNTGIGTYSPNAKLHVNGTSIIGSNSFILPTNYKLGIDGSAYVKDTLKSKYFKMTNLASNGAFLRCDADGNAFWSTGNSVAEDDPQVSSFNVSKIPRWSGITLQDGTISDDGTNVGINASPTPIFKLYVNGGIGTSGDYKYAAARTKYLTMPASSFQLMPLEGVSSAGISIKLANNFGGGLYVENGISSVEALLDAPITLPTGANINKIDVYVRDFSVNGGVSVELWSFDPATFTHSLEHVIGGTGIASQTGNTTISNSLINTTIDQNHNYYLRAKTFENSQGLRVFGAKLTYTVLQVD